MDVKRTINKTNRVAKAPPKAQRITKKSQILAFYADGITDVQELADLTDSKTSYVASVLQRAGYISGYFDLYTESGRTMNAYSQFFRGQLGFKDEAAARNSVALLENFYSRFAAEKDRAGQHHTLMLALTMLNRARWSNKTREAAVFRRWLVSKLEEAGLADELESNLM